MGHLREPWLQVPLDTTLDIVTGYTRTSRSRSRATLPTLSAQEDAHPARRAPKPKLEKGPTQVMLQERYADLQAMYAETTAELRSWYRIGELVWCG